MMTFLSPKSIQPFPISIVGVVQAIWVRQQFSHGRECARRIIVMFMENSWVRLSSTWLPLCCCGIFVLSSEEFFLLLQFQISFAVRQIAPNPPGGKHQFEDLDCTCDNLLKCKWHLRLSYHLYATPVTFLQLNGLTSDTVASHECFFGQACPGLISIVNNFFLLRNIRISCIFCKSTSKIKERTTANDIAWVSCRNGSLDLMGMHDPFLSAPH